MKNWFDHIQFQLATHLEAPAMIMEDRVVTRGMLKAGIERCARRIASLHIDRGGAVAVLIRNPIRHITLSLALFRVGLRSISLEYGQSEIRDLRFDAVLGDRDAGAVINKENRLVEVSDEWFAADPAVDGELPPAFSDPAQVCCLSLTSGTTGGPKLVEHPIDEFGTRIVRQHIDLNWTRMLCLPGLSSNWGFSMSCACLATGRTVCFAESPFQAIRMIELFAIDLVMASMEQVLALTRVARTTGARPASVRMIWLGGSVPTRALLEGAMIYLCNNILCRYAASETGVIAQATAREVILKPGLVGHILPGIEVAIFDQNGRRCPAGNVGAIRVRSDANASRVVRDARWIDLGDAGWIDSENQLYVVGRSSDPGALDANLSPIFEVEHLLRLEWDFTDAAAVLVDGTANGEAPQIWIGIVGNRDATPEKLAALLRPRGYIYPVRLFELRAIPRGANGKVNRHHLKAMMLETAAKPSGS